MGVNTLPVAVDDNIIPAEHNNALVEALLLDLVPRNASRVAQSDAGQLGSSIYRWLRAYLGEVLVGTTANNLKIYEGAPNQLWLEIPNGDILKVIQGSISIWTDGTKRFEIDDTGINWGVISNSTIPKSKVNGFIFTNLNIVDVPQTNTNGATLFTTTATSIIHFLPDGTKMEDDRPVGIYVENLWTDTDGHQQDPFLFLSAKDQTFTQYLGTGNRALNVNSSLVMTMTSMVVPAGKTLKAYINDSSDRLGGALYIQEI